MRSQILRYVALFAMLVYMVLLLYIYMNVGDVIFIFSIVPLVLLLWSFNLYVAFFGQLSIVVEAFMLFKYLGIENNFIKDSHMSGLVLNILILVFVYIAKERLCKASNKVDVLSKEQDYLETMVTNITDVILVLDKNGVAKYVSRNVKKQFGISSDEIIGNKVWHWIHAEDVDEVVNAFDNLLEHKKKLVKVAYRLVNKDNEIRYIRFSSKNMLQNSIVNGVLINFRDYTSQMAGRNALQTSEYRYRTLYNSINEMVCVVDISKRIIDINKSGCRILDLEKIDLIEREFLSFIHFEDRILINDFLSKVGSENCLDSIQVRIVSEKQNVVWGEISSAIYKKEGYEIGLVIIVKDITKEKLDAEKIESLNRARDKFYSIISHDLRTPFATISSYSELIMFQAEKGEYSKVKEYSSLIGQTVDQSRRLLNNLLDWTKTQTGELPFKPGFYNMNNIIENILELYELIAMQKNILLKKDIEKVKDVYLDKNLIGTVLRNIISNAIKFTPVGGEISLRTYKENGRILISVKDTGVGMTKDELNSLFIPGNVVLRHGTDDEEGSGLGLLLSKEFVNMHNGNIIVYSEVGKGTEFEISIPIKEVD